MSWRLSYPDERRLGSAAAQVANLLGMSTEKMTDFLVRYQRAKKPIKFNMSVHVDFVQGTDASIVTFPPVVLVTEQHEVYQDTDLVQLMRDCAVQLGDRIVAYQGTGSGWVIDRLIWLDTTVWTFDPLRGDTFHPLPAWVSNTHCVVNVRNTDNECFRHAVMAALYSPDLHRERVTEYVRFYESEDAPNFVGLEFPFRIVDMRKFEAQNPDVSVNVYGLEDFSASSSSVAPVAASSGVETDDREVDRAEEEDEDEHVDHAAGESTMSDGDGASDSEDDDVETEEDRRFLDDGDGSDGMEMGEEEEDAGFYRRVDAVLDGQPAPPPPPPPSRRTRPNGRKAKGYVFPLRIAPEVRARHVNLLCTEDPAEEGKFHYSTIRNFGGLMRKQYNKHGNHSLHFCYRCLHGFYAKKGERTRESCTVLQDHIRYCKTIKPQRVTYPENGRTEFTNIHKMLKAPVVCYSDMEALLEPHVDAAEADADDDAEAGDGVTHHAQGVDPDLIPSDSGTREPEPDPGAPVPMDIDPGAPGDAVDTPPLPPVGVDPDAGDLSVAERRQIVYQEHVPASYFTRFVATRPGLLPDSDPDPATGFQFPQTETHVGEGSADHMMKYLLEAADRIHGKLFPPPPLAMDPADTERYEGETECHICTQKNSALRYIQHAHRPGDDTERCGDCRVNARLQGTTFTDRTIDHVHRKGTGGKKGKECADCVHNGRIKVRDHDHISGAYRGAAHANCNLQYRISPKTWSLPVFFHNFGGYDSHMIVKALTENYGAIRVIPNNMQQFMALKVGRVMFLDTAQFAKGSLAELVKTLKDEDFVETKKLFGIPDSSDRPATVHHAHPAWENPAGCAWCDTNRAEEKIQQAFQKGVFPYDYLDKIERLTETALPDRAAFYNRLSDTELHWRDELHAERVWELQECATLRDYHDFYLKTDVVLLADFFEKFRTTCLESYGLDAAHYFSTPALALDAALKISGVSLEQLDNAPMYDFYESSIRGGISQISLRHAAANTPAAPEQYDPSEPHVQLIYIDCNNLYGVAMSQLLPTGGFRWLRQEEVDRLDVAALDELGNLGYVMEVDLSIPTHLHDEFNDLPPAPENMTIDPSFLSPYQEQFPETYQKPSRKLAPNLLPKTRYTTHFRNLKFYLELGCVLTKVHRVLEFTQYAWLERYIDYNTQMRTRASTKFGKDFYKLMNNAVFGKTQENLRNRVSVEVVTDEEIAKKRVCKPTFKRSYTIRENLVVMEHQRSSLELNRAIYTGFSVLELSKLWMYDFHYRKMRKWFPDIQLLFTDTDSLAYRICDPRDVYQVMKDNGKYFDFADYPKDHPCYDTRNKKKIGLFTDELNSLCLEEFIGLRPKSYSIKFRGKVENNTVVHLDEDCKKVAKGTKYAVKEKHLKHEHYRQALLDWRNIYVRQNMIRSRDHTLSTIHQCRVSLTCYDTKRWITADGIHTFAHGHYMTWK